MARSLEVPFNRPSLLNTELNTLSEAISLESFSQGGFFTSSCTALLNEIYGNKVSLLTTSCTTALELAAILLDLKPTDEIIVPAFTFVSTANAFASRGAKLRFVDIEPLSLGMDVAALERAVSERTRAIILVHYGGAPAAALSDVLAVAQSVSVPVIEDNAHGFMGSVGGKLLGSFGDLSTLSFHATKNISCGEGGALIINNSKFEARAQIVHSNGTDRAAFRDGLVDKYTWQDFGSSFGIAELLAALLRDQLESRASIQLRRKQIWDRYYSELDHLSHGWGIKLPFVASEVQHACHIFHLLMSNETQRNRFIAYMAEHSIQTCFHYPSLSRSAMARKLGIADACPVAEDISKRLVRLPLYTALTSDQQTHVIDTAKRFFRQSVNK